MSPRLEAFLNWLRKFQDPATKLVDPPGWRISEYAGGNLPSGGFNIATACQYYENLRIASKIFALLGKEQPAEQCRQQAEEVKKQQGHAVRSEIGAEEYFNIRPFGEDQPVRINRQDLAHIIEARTAELFGLINQEIKRSGYDGLLPAGMVLTGGTSALPGIRRVASEVLDMPVRTAGPENLVGLVDRLNSPAYATSVGLLYWALSMRDNELSIGKPRRSRRTKGEANMNLDNVKDWLKRLLP